MVTVAVSPSGPVRFSDVAPAERRGREAVGSPMITVGDPGAALRPDGMGRQGVSGSQVSFSPAATGRLVVSSTPLRRVGGAWIPRPPGPPEAVALVGRQLSSSPPWPVAVRPPDLRRCACSPPAPSPPGTTDVNRRCVVGPDFSQSRAKAAVSSRSTSRWGVPDTSTTTWRRSPVSANGARYSARTDCRRLRLLHRNSAAGQPEAAGMGPHVASGRGRRLSSTQSETAERGVIAPRPCRCAP